MKSCLSHLRSSFHWCLSCTWCTRPLSRVLNSAADLLVDSMLEKLFREKESVRHPHPFLQGMYLNFTPLSRQSLLAVWMLSSLLYALCSGIQRFQSQGILFCVLSGGFRRISCVWLGNCFRCAFPAWPPQIIISASG